MPRLKFLIFGLQGSAIAQNTRNRPPNSGHFTKLNYLQPFSRNNQITETSISPYGESHVNHIATPDRFEPKISTPSWALFPMFFGVLVPKIAFKMTQDHN